MSWAPGDCFWTKGPREPKEHPRIVLTKPDWSERFIVVNITELRKDADLTTVLKKGDHDVVTKDSFVIYRHATMKSVTDLDEDIVRKHARRVAMPFSGSLLKKIQDGILISKLTPNKIKKEFKTAGHQDRLKR
jgi:hypothetical protein